MKQLFKSKLLKLGFAADVGNSRYALIATDGLEHTLLAAGDDPQKVAAANLEIKKDKDGNALPPHVVRQGEIWNSIGDLYRIDEG